jgi:hypothetical protein
MSTFSELIKYKNELLKIEDELKDLHDTSKSLISKYQQIIDEHKKIKQLITALKAQTKSELDNLVNYSFNDDLYCKRFSVMNIPPTSIFDESIDHSISASIIKYNDWHYPSIQINPKFKKWIDFMIAGDPLYLTYYNDLGWDNELVADYPPLYQSRLRIYQITNEDFSILPQNQFGFVLCWEIFNFLSIEKIEQHIRQVFDLLRPGGVFMFSYNNCNIYSIARAAESGDISYTQNDLLKNLCLNIGYEIIDFKDIPLKGEWYSHASWAEIRKPGVLKTVKAHQALAQIIVK